CDGHRPAARGRAGRRRHPPNHPPPPRGRLGPPPPPAPRRRFFCGPFNKPLPPPATIRSDEKHAPCWIDRPAGMMIQVVFVIVFPRRHHLKRSRRPVRPQVPHLARRMTVAHQKQVRATPRPLNINPKPLVLLLVDQRIAYGV